MAFLQRAVPSRMTKEDRGSEASVNNNAKMDSPERYMVNNTGRAVGAYSKAVGKRPSTSHGMETRKRIANEGSTGARTAKEQPPTCMEDLQRSGHTVEYKDGLDTFRFPTPSPHMPRNATTATFRHSPSQLQYEWPAIGVALGSPTNASSSWGRSFTADHISARMPLKPPSRAPPAPPAPGPIEPAAAVNNGPGVRKKKSSWQTIKTVFRWTSKPPVQALQLSESSLPYSEVREAAPPAPMIKELAPSEASSLDLPRPAANRKRHTRMHSGSSLGTMASLERHAPPPLERSSPGLRSSFMPHLRGKSQTLRGGVSPEPGKTSGWGSPSPRRTNDTRHDSPISDNTQYISPAPRTPRLEVNFERPEFERYSVMFEKLLSSESRPTLLERRQSRVQRRKSENKLGDIKIGERLAVVTQSPGTPQRSMTSPHLSKRLSITVGSNDRYNVNDQEPSTAVHRPRQHQRANTAPLNTTSPLATVFTRSRKATLESSPESNESAFFSEASPPSTPATVTTCTDAESIRRETQEAEPAVDTITTNHSHNIVAGSTCTPTQYPRVNSAEDLERQIVQVSVARQVSVSQARAMVQRAVSSNNFRQPIRPRVVELSKYRKSEVGVLESTCEEEQIPVPSRETTKSRIVVVDDAPEYTQPEHGTPRQAPMRALIGRFPDPLKLNPPTPMSATFAESAKK